MLTVQFGVSTFGVVITVTAFMMGLGIGSLIGLRWVNQIVRPLTIFAIIEGSIALYALLLPGVLQTTDMWVDHMATQLSLPQWYGLQGGIALCLLTIPACAMGAGFPLMLKVAEQVPLSLGKLYGLNTLGAVFGALLPLWSLPLLGWVSSLRIVAIFGLVVSAGALALSRFLQPSQPPSGNAPLCPPLRLMIFYAGIGAASLMLEIGWVRLYGMVMLRTEYVLAIILAVYLIGIALGSLLAPRPAKPWLFTLLPLAAGVFTLLSLWLLPVVSAWVEHHEFQSLSGALWTQALILISLTLPVTLTLGAWLPLLTDRLGSSGISGAWLYGVNAIGAGLGAMAAGFVGIPVLGTTATVVIAGIALTVLGLSWSRSSRHVWLILPIIGLCALPVWHLPPVHDLLPKTLTLSDDLYFYEDAISLTHVVQQQNGQRLLLTDLQRMDASTDPSAVQIQADQARLPLLLHPAPHTVLFLGLGTGISIVGSLPFPDLERSAIEISQGAIFAANHWFSPVNENAMRQVKVRRDDARHFLSSTNQHYDVIIGDLFHPDLAGVSSLLSIQQFQRARARLNDDGVFVQWLALNQFDIQSLNAVLRSFHRVFPDGQIFMDGMHLALVGTKRAFADAQAMTKNLQRMPVATREAVTNNEGKWTWLGRYWGPIPDSTGPIQDEWMPFIEYRLPQARYAGELDLEKLLIELLQQRPDIGTAMKLLGVAEADRSAFERAYAASELITRAWVASLSGNDMEAVRLTWLAYQANPRDRWIADGLADNMLQLLPQARQHGLSERAALLRILKIDPTHTETLRALWHLEQSVDDSPKAEQYRLQLRAISPLDREAITPGTRSG
jgi:spermidine synthase